MPQAQTVDIPKRWPLVTAPENRGTTTDKDSRLVNCYAEKAMDGSYWIFKRAGLAEESRPPGADARGLGMFNWLGDIYSVFGAVLYKNGVSIGAVDDTTSYQFSSILGATPKLQLGNGVKSYNYDASAGLVEITDTDFPTVCVKGWAYLDGTTYVGTPTAEIHGSDINDPVNWDPLNFLTAQIEPDQGVALAKQLVYVVMLKQWSTEIFYDAANATGSPLGPVQGAKVNFGCVTADSVQSIDGILIWVCTNQSASTQVIKMDGLKAEIISTNPVERLLDTADFSVTYSLQLKNIGHRFYILTLPNSNLTLCYDLDERLWTQWTYGVEQTYFPFSGVTYDEVTFRHQFQHESNGRIYLANESYYTDAGEEIYVEIITPNFDAEVYRRKQLNMVKFVADQTPGSILEVRHNDNDYAAGKWTQWRQVDLSRRQPMLTQEGTFVRRAYWLRHRKNTPFRIKAVEFQVDIGTL